MATSTMIFQGKTYYSMNKAKEVYSVSEKTLHEWAKTGKAEKKKIGSSTFIRQL